MDGSNRAVIVNLMSIIGLVIDYSTNLLYWTDLGAFAIQKSDFNGNGRVTIHTEPGDPFGYMFFVIQNHIYFTNRRDENHIVGIDTDWNDWEAVGPPQLGGYSGYKAGDGIYGLPANGCTTANGNCRSICVPMPRNRIACL